jgi:hypothetical protein
MASMGFAELAIVLLMAVIYVIPIVAVVWIIFTLRSIRSDFELIQSKLESIERLLQRNSPGA